MCRMTFRGNSLNDVIQGEMPQPTMETDGASVRFEVQVAARRWLPIISNGG